MRLVDWAFRISYALALFFGVACASCGASQPTPAEQYDVGAYQVELGACVTSSATRAAYEACKAAVDARWSGVWKDAGVE